MITATKIKHDPSFTWLMEATWEDVLKKSSDLSDRWIYNREVLVGRSAYRTQAHIVILTGFHNSWVN